MIFFAGDMVAIFKGIRIFGPSRVCLGSHAPFELMQVEPAGHHPVLDGEVSGEKKALIMV